MPELDNIIGILFRVIIIMVLVGAAMIILAVIVSVLRNGGKARETIRQATMSQDDRIAQEENDRRVMREAEERSNDNEDRPSGG